METVVIKDGNGDPAFWQVSGKGTETEPYRPVQDVDTYKTDPIINLYFLMATGAPNTTSSTVAVDDTSIDVVDATSFDADTFIGLFSNTGRFYFGTVLSKVGNTLNLDTPLDFEFPAGSQVLPTTSNLAVDGTTPKIFSVNGSDTFDIDIHRIIFTMILNGAPDDSEFGDIVGGITKGLILRKADGTYRNIYNVKDNGELAGIQYDLTYTTRSGGGGSYGLRCRYTLTNQGSVIKLSAGERLELIIQDDISTIVRFTAIAQGKEVKQ